MWNKGRVLLQSLFMDLEHLHSIGGLFSSTLFHLCKYRFYTIAALPLRRTLQHLPFSISHCCFSFIPFHFFFFQFHWKRFAILSAFYRYNIPELAKTYKVYAIDLLGFGWSDKAIIDYDAMIWRDQVVDFLKEIVKEPAVLVGNRYSVLLFYFFCLLCIFFISTVDSLTTYKDRKIFIPMFEYFFSQLMLCQKCVADS